MTVKKVTPYKDGKRRKMKMTKLTAVALTARGANQHAHVTFFKSDKSHTSVEKRMALTSIEIDHAHGVTIDDWALAQGGGQTTYHGPAADEHNHPYLIKSDGTIEIGAADGHIHFVEQTSDGITKNGLTEEQLVFAAISVTKSTANNGGKQSGNKEDIPMTDAEKVAAALKTAQDDLALSKKALVTAVAMGTMNDGQRAMHKSLTGDAQDEFLAKSVEDREAMVKAANDDNAVVYTTLKGIEFRKSDDSRMVEMAKSNDDMSKLLAKQTAATANLEVAKRATELFKNMTGDAATHTALLKAVETIEDKDLQKSVIECLEKNDAGIAAVLTTHGTVVVNKDADNAEAQLESMTKALMEKTAGLDYLDAYEKVCEANPTLMEKAVG